MLKTTIWISRDADEGPPGFVHFWTRRPGMKNGVFGEHEENDMLEFWLCDCRVEQAEACDGLPVPAPGELLRVEVSAEVVETIKGD